MMEAREAVEQLKRLAPAALRVETADGDKPVDVAIPKVGNRWARLRGVLDQLRWVRIEAVDKDGKLLGVVEDEETETVDEGESAEQHVAAVMLRVMQTTMKEFRLMIAPMMSAMTETLEAVTEGQRAIVDVYSAGLRQAHAMSSAVPAAPEDSEMLAMMKTALPMLLMQRAPVPPKGG